MVWGGHEAAERAAAEAAEAERLATSVDGFTAARASRASAAPVLDVSHLSVTFPSEAGNVAAVRDLSYVVHAGEVLGLVGESGSGKSVSSLAIMGLLPETARVTGSVRFHGDEITGRTDADLSRVRGRKIAMIFQDPLSALTPVYPVGDQIAEAITAHQEIGRDAARARAVELLDVVGIPNAAQRANAFPHEFSGGMRQRAMIAMAIANDPDVIIADEPTTALDVTIQAQILDVLRRARDVTGAAVILITHDLGVIAGFADRVAVMYAGALVETASVDAAFYRPRMPYTIGLLGSIPRLDVGRDQPLTPIEGNPPSLVHLPTGCPFHPRCPMRIDVCVEKTPALAPVRPDDPSQLAACHRSGEIESRGLTGADIFPSPPVPPTAGADTPRAARPTVIEVRDLQKTYALTKGVFRRRIGTVHAVDGISFDIRAGETLGLVGESGCGKTTTIMEILELARPMAGTIVVLGRDTATLTQRDRFAIRRDLQVVFQDPMASLDPRLPIGDVLAEPLRAHGVAPAECARRVRDLLALVGLRPEHANRYPQAFSGGQRQRLGIARARTRAQGARARRARLGARRVDSRGRPQPARAAEGGARAGVPLRRARPFGDSAHRGSRRGDVPRPVQRDWFGGRGLRPARASVHAGAALGNPVARSPEGTRAPSRRPRRRSAQSVQSAVGLPFPHAVPEVRGRAERQPAASVYRGVPGAAAAHGRRRSPGRVPLR
jgi:peptide/nickel transport system ATP-binding protein